MEKINKAARKQAGSAVLIPAGEVISAAQLLPQQLRATRSFSLLPPSSDDIVSYSECCSDTSYDSDASRIGSARLDTDFAMFRSKSVSASVYMSKYEKLPSNKIELIYHAKVANKTKRPRNAELKGRISPISAYNLEATTETAKASLATTVKRLEKAAYTKTDVETEKLLHSLVVMSVVSVLFNIAIAWTPAFSQFLQYGAALQPSSQYDWVSDPEWYFRPFLQNLTTDLSSFFSQGLYVSVIAACVFIVLARCSHRLSRRSLQQILQTVGTVAAFSIFLNVTSYLYGGWSAKAFLFPDVYLGHLTAPWIKTSVLEASFRHMSLFLVGFGLDVLGFYLKFRLVRKYASSKALISLFLSVVLLLSVARVFLASTPQCNSMDKHWANLASRTESRPLPSLKFTQYLPVKDLHLAVDVYLPAKYYKYLNKANVEKTNTEKTNIEKLNIEKIPTILNITRYNRSTEIKWPFTMLSLWGQEKGSAANIWSYQMQQTLVSNGYAVVQVDTRGTGATGGSRALDLSASEVSDFSEIAQWVKRQFWSDGKVAAGGVSYDGMTGMLTAANGEIDAVISLFSPMDVVGTLISPGGTLCSAFINDYTGLTKGFEKKGNPVAHILQNLVQYPLHVVLGFLYVFGGPVGVRGETEKVKRAVENHGENWEMGDMIEQVRFMDDSLELAGDSVPLVEVGIQEDTMEKMARKGVDSFIVAGYCDSSSVNGAAELYRFMRERNPSALSKLTVGSWTHGGKRSCSPYGGSWSCYEKEMYLDVVRFLDCSLKKDCWGDVESEKGVHFWQVGREEWGASDSFPPEEVKFDSASLSSNVKTFNLGAQKIEKKHISTNLYTNKNINENIINDVITDEEKIMKKNKKPENTLLHNFHDMVQILYSKYYERATLHSVEDRMEMDDPTSLLVRNAHSYLMQKSEISPNTVQKTAVLKLFDIYNNYLDLNENKILQKQSSLNIKYKNKIIKYQVDYNATSGKFSRWYIAQHPFGVPVYYGNRLLPYQIPNSQNFTYKKDWVKDWANNSASTETPETHFENKNQLQTPQIKKTEEISWTSETLQEDVHMAGEAEIDISIYVENAKDVYVFAYLEDVDLLSGESHYITEGNIMPTHRRGENLKPSYKRQHYSAVHEDGEVLQVKLHLQPVAHTWKKGHALRLVLTGNDADNFDIPYKQPNWLPSHWHLLAAPETPHPDFTNAQLKLPILV